MYDQEEDNLKKAFRDAAENRSDRLDFYSDLDEKEDRVLVVMPKKKKYRQYTAVAALCVVILSSVLGYSLYNGAADAIKEGVSGVISEMYDHDEKKGDVALELEISDFDDTEKMAEAYEIMPDLIVREIMFDSYKFDDLKITKTVDGRIVNIYADVYYINDEGDKVCTNQIHSTDTVDWGANGITYTEELDNGFAIMLSENMGGKDGYNEIKYYQMSTGFFMSGYIPGEEMVEFVKDDVVDKMNEHPYYE